MTDRLIALIRTVVTGWWASVAAWLVGLGIPEAAAEWVNDALDVVILPAVLAVVYAAIRWAEPRIPDWLRWVLAGSTHTPTYRAADKQRTTLTGDSDA
jgi:hypothetical protein